MQTALIIANRAFEADPLVAVLANAAACPPGWPGFAQVNWPRIAAGQGAGPRCALVVSSTRVEVWCIQDLMDGTVPGGYSNTAEKARALKAIFAAAAGADASTPAAVIAFATAAAPGTASFNGGVMLGRRAFVHKPYADSPDKSPSHWSAAGMMDVVLPSAFPGRAFDQLSTLTSPVQDIHARLLAPPGVPASDRRLVFEPAGVAVSSVNVVDHTQYAITDPAALAAANAGGALPVLSLETTHGLIRTQSEAPFLFVSGIANRVGQYATEDVPYPYVQDFVAAHNAAIALAWLLDWIIAVVESNEA